MTSRSFRLETLGAALTALALLLANIAFVSAHLGVLHKPRRVLETDHYHYLEMAKGSQGQAALAGEPPFCYRVGVPALAGALARTGMGLNAAFYLITNASLFGFLLVTYAQLRALDFDPREAGLGLILTGLMQGAVRWYEYQYWMTDPACLFLTGLSVYLLYKGRFPAAAITLTLATLTRETAVVIVPFYCVHCWQRSSLMEALRRTAALALGPVLVLSLLHTFVVSVGTNPLPAVLADALGFRWRHALDNQPYVLTVGTWGVLLPMALLSLPLIGERLRRHLESVVLLVVVYATLLVANNTERLLAYGLPAMLPAALWGLRGFLRNTAVPFYLAGASAVVIQGYCWEQTQLFEMGSSIYQPSRLGVTAAMILFWVVAQVTFVWRQRAARRS